MKEGESIEKPSTFTLQDFNESMKDLFKQFTAEIKAEIARLPTMAEIKVELDKKPNWEELDKKPDRDEVRQIVREEVENALSSDTYRMVKVK